MEKQAAFEEMMKSAVSIGAYARASANRMLKGVRKRSTLGGHLSNQEYRNARSFLPGVIRETREMGGVPALAFPDAREGLKANFALQTRKPEGLAMSIKGMNAAFKVFNG
jgi:hypothetical protein